MMDIVKVLRDPELIPHKRALLPAAISNAADEIERLRAVVGSIERVAACGTAEAFLGISDDGKRLHFAMSVRDAGRLKKAQEEIERLRAELAKFKEDAERYRWLRYPRMGWDIVRKTDGELLCAEYLDGIELDAAIDAALAAKSDAT